MPISRHFFEQRLQPFRRSSAGAVAGGLILAAAVGLAYAGAAQLSFSWFNANGVGATFFPAAGVTLAALVLSPVRRWPILLLAVASAEFLLDLAHGLGPEPAAGYALANTVEPLLGALLLRAVTARLDLERVRDIAGFLACAVVLAPAAGGAIGATTFVLSEGGESWARFAGEWWVGDGLGVLVVGSAIIAAARALSAPGPRTSDIRRLEALAWVVIAVGTTAAVFWLETLPLSFLPAALLLAVAFRFGTLPVALAGLGVAVVAAQATSNGHVFWEGIAVEPDRGLLYLQLLLGFLIATPLLLAAALRMRDAAVGGLSTALRRAAAADAAAVLAAAGTPDDVVDAFVALGRRRFGAARGLLAIERDGRIVPHFSTDALEARARWPELPHGTPVADALARGERIEVGSSEELKRSYPALAETLLAEGLEAFVAQQLPAVAGAPRGAASLAFAGPRRLTGEEWEFFESIAAGAGQALARAQLHADERAARRRIEGLQRLTAALATASTPDEVLQATVRLSAEALDARGVTVSLLSHGATMLEVVALEGYEEALAETPYVYRVDDPSPAADAIRRRQPLFLESFDGLGASYPELAGYPELTGDRASASMPLTTAAGEQLGVLYAGFAAPRRFDPEDRELAVAIARQAGQALERSHLMRDEERARRRAELLTAILSALETVPGLQRRAVALVESLVPRVADFACVELPERVGAPLLALAHREPDAEHRLRQLRDSVHRHGHGDDDVLTDLGAFSWLRLPLRVGERSTGELLLGLDDRARRPYDAHDAAFLEDLASRAGTALENARLEEDDRRTALRLQQALLPGSLPDIPGVRMHGLYEAAHERLEIGGDWYDVIDVGEGLVAFVVGDVVGHGLESAVAMGRLRTALAAFAVSEREPAAVLDRVEAFAEGTPGAHYATVCYALLDLRTGLLRYAMAGHPPPVLLQPGLEPSLLEGGGSPPLCAFSVVPRPVAEIRLPAGSTLVLYTDGLIERRGTGLGERIDELLVTAAATIDGTHASCRSLLEKMTGGQPTDDVAVLAVRLDPAPVAGYRVRVRATPGELAGMRRTLRNWLSEIGVDGDERQEMLIGVGEALANAIEHAYLPSDTGEVAMELELLDGTVDVIVRDWGRWRPAGDPGERGRGLPLMHALFDSVQLEPGETGTLVRLSRRLRQPADSLAANGRL